jgi:two-component system, NarL family, nitrate/nitrite response regulator NarL
MRSIELDALRDTVRTLSREHAALPLGALAATAELANGARITIDLAATREVGFPIVVMHAPETREPAFLERLSARERGVARLLAAGRSNKEIAAALGISLGTAKDHVHAVLSKSGLSSRLEVASAFISPR